MQAPVRCFRGERASISLPEMPALAQEQIGVGFGQQAGIRRGGRAAEVDRAGDLLREMRLELAQFRSGEHRVIDPVFVVTARVVDPPVQALLGSQTSDTALVL